MAGCSTGHDSFGLQGEELVQPSNTEETVTRMEESRRMSEWMQAVVSSDQNLMGEVLRLGLEALMEAERDFYVNAGPYERGEGRRTYRNGYKPRQKRTRVGTLRLRVPQTHGGGLYPSVLSKYQRSEGALISTLAECYLQGVSTRKVSRICEELFGEGISHETVSRYTRELDEGLSAWREWRLEGEAFPYMIVDARYEKARVDSRVVDVALLIAVGVSESGKRHLLGVEVAHGETRASWSAFFEGLLERGLRGVELLVSDAHAGLADARRRHFPGVPWQRCQRHFLMNGLEKAPRCWRICYTSGYAVSGTRARIWRRRVPLSVILLVSSRAARQILPSGWRRRGKIRSQSSTTRRSTDVGYGPPMAMSGSIRSCCAARGWCASSQTPRACSAWQVRC